MFEPSKTWISFNYICVSTAYVMLMAFLLFAPLDMPTRGYLAMGVVFLSGSLVTLVKTLHDRRVASDVSAKLERAKHDRLLKEYAENT